MRIKKAKRTNHSETKPKLAKQGLHPKLLVLVQLAVLPFPETNTSSLFVADSVKTNSGSSFHMNGVS
jgi:hypothetical protein